MDGGQELSPACAVHDVGVWCGVLTHTVLCMILAGSVVDQLFTFVCVYGVNTSVRVGAFKELHDNAVLSVEAAGSEETNVRPLHSAVSKRSI